MHITLGASISSVGTVQQWPEQGKLLLQLERGKIQRFFHGVGSEFLQRAGKSRKYLALKT